MLPFGEVAPIRRRVIAYVIDALIAAAVAFVVPSLVLVIVAVSSGDPLTALLIAAPLYGVLGLAWFVVYTVMQAGRGSIGMRAQGVRLVGLTDGRPIGVGRALLRNVIWGLATSIAVGYFTPLFDGSGRYQGWHDKIAGAVVLDTRASAPQAPAAGGHALPQPAAAPSLATPAFAGTDRPSLPGTGAPTFGQGVSFADVHGDSFARVRAQVQGNQPAAGPVADPQPVAAPQADGAPQPGVGQPPADLPEETVVAPRQRGTLPGDPLISFVPGVTQPPPERPLPSAPAAPTSAPTAPPAAATPSMSGPAAPQTPASDGAASAVDAEDIESTRISIPGHRLVFTWDDGQRVTVSGRTLFGRNPEEEPGAVAVAVRDETLSLSKTHFEAGAEPSGGWVMDRQSTNGTVILREGARIDCPPGQRVPVRLGDALEIGDRIVTIGGYA